MMSRARTAGRDKAMHAFENLLTIGTDDGYHRRDSASGGSTGTGGNVDQEGHTDINSSNTNGHRTMGLLLNEGKRASSASAVEELGVAGIKPARLFKGGYRAHRLEGFLEKG